MKKQKKIKRKVLKYLTELIESNEVTLCDLEWKPYMQEWSKSEYVEFAPDGRFTITINGYDGRLLPK